MQLLQEFSSSCFLKDVPFLVVPLFPRSLRIAISEVVANYRGEACNAQMRTTPRID